jgi:hypothetical protein
MERNGNNGIVRRRINLLENSVEYEATERPREEALAPIFEQMDSVAQNARMKARSMGAFHPQLPRRALRAHETLGGVEPNAYRVRPAATRAFRLANELDRRPAVIAEVDVLFGENPLAAFLAKRRQKEVLETQQNIVREKARRRPACVLSSYFTHWQPPMPDYNTTSLIILSRRRDLQPEIVLHLSPRFAFVSPVGRASGENGRIDVSWFPSVEKKEDA